VEPDSRLSKRSPSSADTRPQATLSSKGSRRGPASIARTHKLFLPAHNLR
jgi:hypothetical protein